MDANIVNIKSVSASSNINTTFEAQFMKKLTEWNGSGQWKCSVRKGALRNFTKFTGKH